MFNVRSQTEAARYQRYFLRLMESFERKLRPNWFSLLQDVFAKAATNIEHSDHDMNAVIKQHRIDVHKRLSLDYRNILAYFGSFTFDQFNKTYKKSIKAPNVKGMEEAYWDSVQQWSKSSALKKSLLISDNTKQLIHGIVRRGMRDGLSNADLVKQLREGKKDFNKVRATRIVRTETHSAANKATEAGVRSTGYPHDKVWRATLDDRVRGLGLKDRFNHIRANGQKRTLEEDFDVSGQKLSFPGDPKGSAGNIVNCRCVLTYETKRGNVDEYSSGRRGGQEDDSDIGGGWTEGTDISAVREQIKDKYNGGLFVDSNISKEAAERVAIGNDLGAELARINEALPGLDTYLKKNEWFVTVTDKAGFEKFAKGAKGKVSHWVEKDKRIVLNWDQMKTMSQKGSINAGKFNVTSDKFGPFRHSLGHHLDAFGDASEWEKLFNVDKISSSISKYGATNSKEFFAESFTLRTHPGYTGWKKRLSRPAKKHIDAKFIGEIDGFMEKRLSGEVVVKPIKPVRKPKPVDKPKPKPVTEPGAKPNPDAPDEEWHSYMSSWNKVDNYGDSKKQLRDKFKVDNFIISEKLKLSPEKMTKLANEIGEEFATMHKYCPGLSKQVRKNSSLSTLIIADKKVAAKIYSGKRFSNGISGFYSKSQRRICIRYDVGFKGVKDSPRLSLGSWHSSSDKYSTLRHEYGHHMHGFRDGSWDSYFGNDRKRGLNKKVISQYGSTNEREAFAEAFCAFTSRAVRNPEVWQQQVNNLVLVRHWSSEQVKYFDNLQKWMSDKIGSPVAQIKH